MVKPKLKQGGKSVFIANCGEFLTFQKSFGNERINGDVIEKLFTSRILLIENLNLGFSYDRK